jgi:hypothetical protein
MKATRFILALQGLGLSPARMQVILTALVVMASLRRKVRLIGGRVNFGAVRVKGQ